MIYRRIIILALFLFFWHNIKAQNGNYFITNLTPTDDRIDPRSIGITQNDLGVIYFTNKNGILEFDGSNWRLIPTNGSVYTIVSHGKEIFAGGAFGFGRLISNAGKGNEFLLLSNKSNIFSSLISNGQLYFCSESELFTYSLERKELVPASLSAGADNFFTGLHSISGKPYVSSVQHGLQLIDQGTLSNATLTLPDKQSIMFSIPLSITETLLGTETGKIYRLNNDKSITPFRMTDTTFLDFNGLVNGVLVKDNLIALGTLKGGVVFVNARTGATQEIIDYNIGLPDNDVLALFTDRNNGVWVAHEYGFSRIAPFLPFRSFNRYPGLSGNLLCVKEIDGKLFAGTSLGLYYLKTEDIYEEVEVIQRSTKVVPAVVQKEKTRKKLFGFLRSKKNREPEPVPVVEQPKTQTTIKRTTKKILKSRQYVYQKVEGINGKVTQLLDVNGTTIAAGLAGVFALNGTTAQYIFSAPVRYVFHSLTLNQLFISTYDDRTVSLELNNKAWQQTHLADTLREFISFIFEDHQQNIWFCGKTTIYKMELVDNNVTALKAIPIQNPLYDETVGISMGNDVYIAASGIFKRYDGNNSFINYDSLPGPKKYFASAGNFWFNDGHTWRTINNKIQSFKLEWLGFFPNLRYLNPSSDGKGLWVVTAHNELYKFTNPNENEENKFYPLFLHDVRGDQIRLLEENNLSMNQSENTVYFEFTQPNYMGIKATEFRYLVRGLTNEWSSWSNVNNQISFSFLPPGEYQLAVQSRDMLGNISEIEEVSFEVLPYYWKRWWFYALEFVFFTLLVLLSIRLGRGNQRYKIISQFLSLLTVILLIQLIETGINSMVELKSTPVVEFLIQVGITLIVFPVESKLEGLMHYVSARKLKSDKT